MNRIIIFFNILIAFICLSSCEHYNQEYLEESCYSINRINSIKAEHHSQSISIIPDITFNRTIDNESRQFYNSVDTSFVYKGWVNKRGAYAEKMEANWSLIDWRLTSIVVIALDSFDSAHPAGSCLNDVLEVCYFYKRSYITISMDALEYGKLMLTDFYPNRGDDNPENAVLIRLHENDERILPPCEIVIKDFFGQTFTARTNE